MTFCADNVIGDRQPEDVLHPPRAGQRSVLEREPDADEVTVIAVNVYSLVDADFRAKRLGGGEPAPTLRLLSPNARERRTFC